MNSIKTTAKLIGEGTLNSYTQVFFSLKKWFAVILILVSFIDFYAGLSGFLAVVFTQLLAWTWGFNRDNIRSGLFGFNSLLVGMSLGVYFKFNSGFFIILFFASLFTLLFCVLISGILQKYGLPFLSIPFIMAIWAVLLAVREYGALEISERGIYTINELYSYGGKPLLDLFNFFENLPVSESLKVYFKSLGAIFFEYNILAGVLIAAGLLIWSRIAFSLSLLGFYAGYLFYYLLEGDITQLHYSYIGFNFILSSIAIGGFFLVPSVFSYFYVLMVTPVIAIINSSIAYLLASYQLPVYSFPFAFVVILVVYVLKLRTVYQRPYQVSVQHYSPEINLYKYLNSLKRFKNSGYALVQLPFFGEWMVSQGYKGNITHRGEWDAALDFVIEDDNGKTFKAPGISPEHFYCYNKPVLAPADGWVAEINDHIDDNEIGEVNLQENWGNSIVLRHSEYLYSQVSHILKDSFKVKVGDYVKKGDVLARIGNSGRSPEPHMHFQLQSTPYVGSKTLSYPISYFIKKSENKTELCSFSVPSEGDTVSNVEISPLLHQAFNFIPGKTIRFKVNENSKDYEVIWEVMTDYTNNSYVFCHNSGSYAYFINNGTMVYFTEFQGERNSLLYYFYLGAYKVLLGFYEGIEITDKMPVDDFYGGGLKWIQDFFAPFYIFLKAEFSMKYLYQDDFFNARHIILQSKAKLIPGREYQFDLEIMNSRIERFTVSGRNKKIIATCTG